MHQVTAESRAFDHARRYVVRYERTPRHIRFGLLLVALPGVAGFSAAGMCVHARCLARFADRPSMLRDGRAGSSMTIANNRFRRHLAPLVTPADGKNHG